MLSRSGIASLIPSWIGFNNGPSFGKNTKLLVLAIILFKVDEEGDVTGYFPHEQYPSIINFLLLFFGIIGFVGCSFGLVFLRSKILSKLF